MTCTLILMKKNFFIFLLTIAHPAYTQITCNNWLSTPVVPSSVTIGQLNIPGDKVTVEGVINRTAPYSGGQIWAGDVVSKHSDPNDANYLLRPNSGEITTTNGYFKTPDIADINLNQTYHIAMVYDGDTLKFYRDGCLMSKIAASGNLYQNSWDTRIGYYQNQFWNTNFIGYINEVRIWNVARTQAQIQAYMNTSLPNPTSQSGLLAYYTFDNLTNKQGNAAYNGTLNGGAAINATNPNCAFIADLCLVPNSISNIINDYTEVLGLDACKNELTVADAHKYNIGDTVLLIQMKGAVIDSTNTPNFGTVTDYKNAGNYEFNIIKQKNGNNLSLLNVLERKYDIPNGKVQLIRVPYYTTANITSTLTCLPWDGSKGGVLVLNAKNGVNMSADIDVSGKGFKGGNSRNPNTTSLYCDYNKFYYPANTQGAAAKGESVSDISSGFAWGKGALSNGGGGGNGHNSGGGGGSNGGQGGLGGYQLDACGGSATDNRGIGGKDLSYNNVSNKIFLGGGGGSGHTDNAGGPNMNGANGGGIIIIRSPMINNSGFKINAKGADIINCNLSPIDLCHDGSGGGGGGGSVLIESNDFTSSTPVDVSGGKGGDLVIYRPPNGTHIGPGGGGGAGVFWTNSASTPANINVIKNGGKNGVIIPDANNPYGTTPGQDGLSLLNLKIPIDNILFKPNIDSVRIKESIHNCNTIDFNGLPFTQIYPISNWNWNFGDGNAGNVQNVTHAYVTSGVHNVKLIATDINGCKDSVIKIVTTKDINVTKSPDTSLCGSLPVKIFAAGGSTYSWSPTAGLDNPNISNPVATPLSSTIYYVTVSNTNGCSKTDSISIEVNSLPVVSKSKDTVICKKSEVQLFASGGNTYAWSPENSLNNPGIANPIAKPSSNITYIVKVTNINGCSKIDSVKIKVNPVPVIVKSNDTTVCSNTPVRIFADGGNSYSWSPASTLDNPSIAAPVASPSSTTVYHVSVTDAQSCSYNDSVKISVRAPAAFSVSPDKSVCANETQQLSASGGDTYLWSPDLYLDNSNMSNPIATPDKSITYSVTIKENTCKESATLFTKLTLHPLPILHVSKLNDITCSLPSTQLLVSGAYDYTWMPVTGLNNSEINNPIATPVISTTYTVTGKDKNGCTSSEDISVNVDFNRKELYAVPNSFTPNGDGLNDCFGIIYWGHVNELNFSIYNRFGEKIFYTNNSTICWDGTYKGEPQDAGVFVYLIKAKTVCGNIDRKGIVTLLR